VEVDKALPASELEPENRRRADHRAGVLAEGIAMQVNAYRSLLLHMEWADSLTWGAVLNVSALGRDKEMRERLHHFHSTQWAYLQLFQGQKLDIPDLASLPDLRSVGLWARQFYRELPAYRDALDETRLRENLEFPWAAQVAERLGSAGPATIGESIQQLALHTAHHRGQVVTRLRESGGEPPLTDFIAWIWMLRPAPQWGSLDG
jgi:uncharacterized damage-inducible protein DinB